MKRNAKSVQWYRPEIRVSKETPNVEKKNILVLLFERDFHLFHLLNTRFAQIDYAVHTLHKSCLTEMGF